MRWLALAVLVTGCRGGSSGSSSTSSGPFEHVHAKLEENSLDKDKPHATYLTVTYKYTGSPQATRLGYKCACRVGDTVFVDVGAGYPAEGPFTPFVIGSLPDVPDLCELTLTDHWQYDLPPAPDAVFCLKRDGDVEPHACSPPIVKAVPQPSNPEVPVAISQVKLSMSDSLSNTPSLLVEWMTTATGAHSPKAQIGFVSRCLDEGQLITADGGCFDGWGALGPGESRTCGQLPHTGRHISSSPTYCEVTFQSQDKAGDPPVDLVTYCFHPPAQVTRGACAP